ncbi:MAG TPA: hypothetical protein VHX65_12770 [Pirellulales bacterium]|nr:hypothetical protein [Pirellulales bacterium]
MEKYDSMIMHATPGTAGSLLHWVKDLESGEYEVPDFSPSKREVKFLYMLSPNANERDFDSAWPAIWKLKQFNESFGQRRSSQAFAIVDTGLMLDHPLLKSCIEGSKDFTGEGPEDLHGHGTIRALQVRLMFPFKIRIFNVKVAGAVGRGSSKDLINGVLPASVKKRVPLRPTRVRRGMLARGRGSWRRRRVAVGPQMA